MTGGVQTALSLQLRRYMCRYKSTRTRTDPVRITKDSSLLDTATKFLVDLRWKAAVALTESMPEGERHHLVRIFQPSKETSDSNQQNGSVEPSPVSVDEAVAAAVLKEQERLAIVKEDAVARAVAQAEKAAQDRVQTELAIMQHRQQAYQAWQSTVNKEANQGEEEKAAQEPAHPILGPCVADLGTKRVHLVQAKALASIPVWNQQRIYRHERAKAMAMDKLKTSHLGMLGVIGLFHDSATGKLSVIDGQHRVAMMSILESKHGMKLDRVLVEVYTDDNLDDEQRQGAAAAIFEEINKAEPVKLVDLPGMMKSIDRKTLNGGVERLSERFPAMFSASSRCRAPHVSIDNMRDALFAANVLDRHQIKSPKGLEEWLLRQNELLKVKYETEGASVPKQALAKAQKYDFYLGLSTSWYHN